MADSRSNTEPDEIDKEKKDKEGKELQANKEEELEDSDKWSSSVPSPRPSEPSPSPPPCPPHCPPPSPPLDVCPPSKVGNDGASVDESVENKEKKKEAESAARESFVVTKQTLEKVGGAVYSLLHYNNFNT